MTEQQYLQEIKNMILSSLKIEYSVTLPNKQQLERDANYVFVKLIQDENLFNQIAEDIKKWSYTEASKFQYAKKPEMARQFLSLVGIRDFTTQYIKKIEQQNEMLKQQTR